MKKQSCAVILGGYVNGYYIITELYEKGIKDIFLFDTEKTLAAYSNKITRFVEVESWSNGLYRELRDLHQDYEKLILFPTDDTQLENLASLYALLKTFCFLPFNNKTYNLYVDKHIQYSCCHKLGVSCPKSERVENVHDLEKIETMDFPVLIKPTKREDLKTEVFRSLQLNNIAHYQNLLGKLENYLRQDIDFLVSEIIPGDGSNIYAYVGYRSKSGKILNEWTGKKLAQYPDDFGVFSSASNQAPVEILKLGRTLLNGMDLYGICEPEFKYDYRDNKYKLMEINYRSMMWHRVGNLSNVNIQYTQYIDALGKTVERQTQLKNKKVHFVYLKYEIVNLLRRKKYLKTFLNNILKSDETYYALLSISDIKPFIVDIKNALLVGARLLMPRLKEYGFRLVRPKLIYQK